MKSNRSPSHFTHVDASDHPEQWIAFMNDWSALPSIILQRENLFSQLDLQSGAKILIAGCGTGDVTKKFNSVHDVAIYGIDLSQAMIDYAVHHYSDVNVHFEQADIAQLPAHLTDFDCIWVERVLHHIPNATDVLAHLVSVLSLSGRLVIAEPYIPSTFVSDLSDESIQKFANGWSSTVANGTVGASVVSCMRDLGFHPECDFGSFVCINDFQRIQNFIDISLFLPKHFSQQEVSDQIDKWTQSSVNGVFQLKWPMFNYIFSSLTGFGRPLGNDPNVSA